MALNSKDRPEDGRLPVPRLEVSERRGHADWQFSRG